MQLHIVLGSVLGLLPAEQEDVCSLIGNHDLCHKCLRFPAFVERS